MLLQRGSSLLNDHLQTLVLPNQLVSVQQIIRDYKNSCSDRADHPGQHGTVINEWRCQQ